MSNKRIYYAVQNVALAGNIDGNVAGTPTEVGGLQSVGINTSFTLDPAYQLGQLASYYITEGVPEVEVTLSKVIDGREPVYLKACGETASGKSLAELQNARATLQLSIFNDKQIAATGTAVATVKCTGMYVSSVSYNLTNDGNFTEELTLVGNHKEWSGSAVQTATGIAPVAQRWAFNKASSTIPASVGNTAVLNSATASVSLGRESIFVLGQRTPYHRYATFPVEVTSEFQVLAQNSDGVGAAEIDSGCSGAGTNNLSNETIILVVCALPASQGETVISGRKSVTIDLGTQNKLTSVNYSGGDTGGGNATITYSYRNYNDFKVTWA
jgi:hypothetical protein